MLPKGRVAHLRSFRGPSIVQRLSASDPSLVLIEYHFDERGLLHREPAEGPALLQHSRDGELYLIEFRWHGLLHRDDDEPAVISYNPGGVIGHKWWFRYGRRHRDQNRGPAVIIYNFDVDEEHRYYAHGYTYRDPRTGPQFAQYNDGKVVDEGYSSDAPDRPKPRARWLRSTYGPQV
jgi:hypothetical protein